MLIAKTGAEYPFLYWLGRDALVRGDRFRSPPRRLCRPGSFSRAHSCRGPSFRGYTSALSGLYWSTNNVRFAHQSSQVRSPHARHSNIRTCLAVRTFSIVLTSSGFSPQRHSLIAIFSISSILCPTMLTGPAPFQSCKTPLRSAAGCVSTVAGGPLESTPHR